MTETYFYMWEFFTSVTILLLIAAYVIHDQIRKRKEKTAEPVKEDHSDP
jgi:hypothetical protein